MALVGAILLIAGCCIGAGMLGVPVVSAAAGFRPSIMMFLLGWAYMVATGLLLLEVNLWFNKDTNLVSISGRLLGNFGKIIAWSGFLFIFYALNISYISGSGEMLVDIFGISPWSSSLLSTLILGVILYSGIQAADQLNRLFMLGLIICYIIFVILGTPHVKREYLTFENWMIAPTMLPMVILSFGYHNLIPTLVTYLHRDVKLLRLAILLGSAIPLVFYLVWEWLILGLIPLKGAYGLQGALDEGQMATHLLQAATGNPWINGVAQGFALFAIATSFISVSISFVDFLADGLKIDKTKKGKAVLCLLVLLPPLFFAVVYPQIFLTALSYAGGIGAVVLFGFLPVAMAWKGRYFKNMDGVRLLPGGKFSLLVIFSVSLMILLIQLSSFHRG